MSSMTELGLKFTAAYLLGSILGGLLVGSLRGGIDIRRLGSGNPGGTNALRTQGGMFALWVMMIDVGKGVLAVLVLPGLALPVADSGPTRELLVHAVAFGAVVGHVFPVWHQFLGGKGGATAAGVLCALEPWLAPPVIGFWLAVVAATGYVGLATMSAAVGAAVFVGLAWLPAERGLFVFAVLTAALLVYTHRGNIRRMRDGTEPRMRLSRRRE